MGAVVGLAVGAAVGLAVGAAVGLAVGVSVGLAVGAAVGLAAGSAVGLAVGAAVGLAVGAADCSGSSGFGVAVASSASTPRCSVFSSSAALRRISSSVICACPLWLYPISSAVTIIPIPKARK